MYRRFRRSAPAVALILLCTFHPAIAAEDSTDPPQLTLERIFEEEEFEVETFGPARWLKNGSGYTTLEASKEVEEAKEIVRYDPATGERTILVPATSLVPAEDEEPLTIDDYQWSEDGRRLLVFTNTKKVWRRHTRGDYWLLDIGSSNLQQLGGGAEESSMMFAKLSPDGTRVAWVDFGQKDIFVQDLEDLTVIRLTNDVGEHIINGTSDWVYEEEFGLRDGFRWSPDGRHIAYWQFDSEGVQNFNLINNTDTLYPELTPIPYPKVGTTNSACRVGVVPAGGGNTTWFEPEGDPRNHYIPKMGWAENPDEIWLIKLNRLQNAAQVMLGSIDTGALRSVFTDNDAAWIDMRYGDPQWLDDGRWFTWLSERDGWRHLYLVSRDGKEERLVTIGDYDITEAAQPPTSSMWAASVMS